VGLLLAVVLSWTTADQEVLAACWWVLAEVGADQW
jgi:hypothetical protein